MNITFDTNNPKDLEFLDRFLAVVAPTVAPAVAPYESPTLPCEGNGVGEEAEVDAAPATDKKRGRKPKEVVAVERVKESASPVEPQSGTDAVVSAPHDKPLTLDDVRAALQQYTAVKGIVEGMRLLRKYDAGRVSELSADKYSAFIAECGV